MKKILLSVSAVVAAVAVNAQTTLASHFAWALANPQAPEVAVYNWANNAGFVAGNNTFGDLASVQLFNAQTGVTDVGTVTKAFVWIPVKTDAGGSININVYENNAGAVGAILGTQTVSIASIDTASTAVQVLLSNGAPVGVYNVQVTFATPVQFTANGFWVGYTFGTGSNVIAGATTTDNQASWALATSHSGVISSANAFDNYGQYNLHVAHAIFPEVIFGGASTGSLTFNASVYPNPASDVLNVNTNGVEVVTFNVYGLDGKVVASSNGTSVNVEGLTAGMYIYEVIAANGAVAKNTFVKK